MIPENGATIPTNNATIPESGSAIPKGRAMIPTRGVRISSAVPSFNRLYTFLQ